MRVKIHKSYRNIIAICDSNLLSQKFEQDNTEIDLTGEFFNGEEFSSDEVLSIIQDGKTEDATFNIVGEKAVALALKSGIISKEGIITIQDIPIALTLL